MYIKVEGRNSLDNLRMGLWPSLVTETKDKGIEEIIELKKTLV